MNELSYQTIGCAIEVHRQLGPGLLESVYEKCLIRELDIRGISNKSQVRTPLEYKGLLLDTELRLDVLIDDILCVELKAQDGLLINFHCLNIFKEGQKTLVNSLFALLPDE